VHIEHCHKKFFSEENCLGSFLLSNTSASNTRHVVKIRYNAIAVENSIFNII